jgi:hypothetical protein
VKNPFLIFIIALSLIGCATQPSQPLPTPEASATLDAPFDKVWGAVVGEIVNEYPVQVIEKQSGVLQSQMVNIGSGFGAEGLLGRYGTSPGIFLATWSGARASLSAFVKPVDDNHTSVRIRGHFEGFENNVTQSWQVWRSKAILEGQILDRVSAQVREPLKTSEAKTQ